MTDKPTVGKPEFVSDTGEWVVIIEGNVYSFDDESDADQFYQVQLSFATTIEEWDNGLKES